MTYPKVILHRHRVAALERRHPWLFSGAIQRIEGKATEGCVVDIYTPDNQYVATGHFQAGGSIAIRLLSFEQTPIDAHFWTQKIQLAYQYRQQLGLGVLSATNVFRLINAEGDGLPGLIVDYYHGTAVVQMHTWGMYNAKNDICEALKNVLGNSLHAIYHKSAETLPKLKGSPDTIENGYLWGMTAVPSVVTENHHRFAIDWETGQKTGFFIDQRLNRQLLADYAQGKTVLNAFSYSGGFSVYALVAGALRVDSVDVSQKAIDLCNQNVALNNFDSLQHQAICDDVLKYLQHNTTPYDIVVLDPPAFAKHLDARHKAVQGYKRLNVLGLKNVKPGGILFTFSCSAVVDRQLFYDTIVAAAIEVGRNIRVMHQLSQPPDHPISIYHTEGHYLKGLVLYVE